EPKLIKGPDLFLETVESLSKIYPIHCLLTGPSRGYVMNGLRRRGISFTHRFLKTPDEVAKLYQCLDLYVISSREEGGPKALLEAMAARVPVVTSRVGMAADIIENGKHAWLADVGDVEGLIHGATQILKNQSLTNQITDHAS